MATSLFKNMLTAKIKQSSQEYYSTGKSSVSDAEFDKMLDQLKEIDPESEILTDTGHGYDIELDSTPGQKVPHRYGHIGSLDKCHNYSELDSRLKGCSLNASLKLDGLSVVLYYSGGALKQALTRGKGDVGIDITPKILEILDNSEINIADVSFTGAVRGEILMSHENFNRYLAEVDEYAENARNTAAGLINMKEIKPELLKYLHVVVYTVVGVEAATEFFLTYQDMFAWLSSNFNHIVPVEVISENTITNNLSAKMFELQSKWYGTYPADGIVLTKDKLISSPGKSNGFSIIYTANAFKFPAEQTTSVVTDVEWTLSKTRYMIPVIKMEPVRLAGTTVQAATGLHAKFIKENSVGKGAIITLEKANEIIPKVISVDSPGECVLPTNCPACGSSLSWNGVHLQCTSEVCSGGDTQDVLIWLQTLAPTEGLGDTLKLKFLEETYPTVDSITVDTLYTMTPNIVQDSSVQRNLFYNMLANISTNKIKLCDAIRALNIPRFGEVNSRKLAEYPELVQNLMNQNTSLFDESKLIELSDKIGNANAEAIIKHKNKFVRLQYIASNMIWEQRIATKGKVAITGKLSVSRSIFEEELRNAGYTPGSIGKDTKFLITDNPFSSSSKNQTADKLGIPKITEVEFRQKYM